MLIHFKATYCLYVATRMTRTNVYAATCAPSTVAESQQCILDLSFGAFRISDIHSSVASESQCNVIGVISIHTIDLDVSYTYLGPDAITRFNRP